MEDKNRKEPHPRWTDKFWDTVEDGDDEMSKKQPSDPMKELLDNVKKVRSVSEKS